jgi:diacylglycerol kinase family enzyme
MDDGPSQVAAESMVAIRVARRRALLVTTGAFVAGAVGAAIFLRRQLLGLAARAVPYVREPATLNRPTLIINRWSGDGRAERVGLEDACRTAGITTVMLEPEDDLAQLARDAIANGADAIGMAGGDGSLATVAAVAMETGVPFFCVPVGTRNHFALDLGLDRDDPLSALDALSNGELVKIDHGIAGGQFFLNNVSLGMYAQAIHHDDYRDNKSTTMAETIAAAAASPDDQAAIRYVTPDGTQHQHAPMILISNNPYQMTGPPDFGRRLRLDSGKLGISALTSMTPLIDIGAQLLNQSGGHQSWEAKTYRIESDNTILAGVDGEAKQFDSPLDVSIRRRALTVLVPSGTKPGFMPPRQTVAAKVLDLASLSGEVDY